VYLRRIRVQEGIIVSKVAFVLLRYKYEYASEYFSTKY
jgi:hypothetical protein